MTAPHYRIGAAFMAQCRRDLTVALRDSADWLNPLLFFGMVITLFPLGISPSRDDLSVIAGGVLWIAALLATLLSLDSLFRRDYDDGSLEQIVLGIKPATVAALAKLTSCWLLTGLPLSVLAPLLSYALYLPDGARGTLFLSLLLGTPTLCMLGGFGAALTVGLRRGGVLLSLLVLPLMVPVLIIGVSAAELAAQGLSARAPLLWQGVLLLGSATVLPLMIGAAMKLSVER